jgi:hypothetical protein
MNVRFAMRKALCLVFVLILVIPESQAQVNAVRAGSAEAARLLAENQRRAAAEADDWKLSKKLTILDSTPTTSTAVRGQHACMDPESLSVGTVGYLEYWQYNIAQVMGPNDLLLTIRNPKIPPVWLTGYSTKGLADGDLARILGLVEVTGTKTYETVAGSSKTVRVIQFINAARIAEIESAKVAAAEAALTRTWTDSLSSSIPPRWRVRGVFPVTSILTPLP